MTWQRGLLHFNPNLVYILTPGNPISHHHMPAYTWSWRSQTNCKMFLAQHRRESPEITRPSLSDTQGPHHDKSVQIYLAPFSTTLLSHSRGSHRSWQLGLAVVCGCLGFPGYYILYRLLQSVQYRVALYCITRQWQIWLLSVAALSSCSTTNHTLYNNMFTSQS